MRSASIRKICVFLTLVFLLGLSGCAGENPPEISVPTETTVSTETTPAEIEQTQPTQSEPIETAAQETAAPTETVPPETEPPATDPPATQPPETPPATEPPMTQPAPTTPPATEPAQVEYEYGDHYIHIINYTPAPNEHGHIYWCSEGTGKFYKGEYIFDVDYKTITYEIWCGWGPVVQMAFRSSQTCSCSTDYQMTPEETYYFNRITEYENYTCGFENHYCSSQGNHDRLMREIADGCYFCGRSDCVSFTARNELGLTQHDKFLCPEYDVYRDPWFYCQECNMPTWQTIQDVTKCCHTYIRSVNCYECGVWVEARACHTCKQEDIDAFKAAQGG